MWNNKKVFVNLNGQVVMNYEFNTWDFTNFDGTLTDYELLYNKVYRENIDCATKVNTVTVHHDVASFGVG